MLPHSGHYEPYYMLGPKAHSGYLAISDPLGPLGPAGHALAHPLITRDHGRITLRELCCMESKIHIEAIQHNFFSVIILFTAYIHTSKSDESFHES